MPLDAVCLTGVVRELREALLESQRQAEELFLEETAWDSPPDEARPVS